MATEPVLFPLWPRAGVSERLEWMTDVIPHEDGTEERTGVRATPRQFFRMTYYVASDWEQMIKNILYGGRRSRWWVPVWPQVQHVGGLTADDVEVACDTRFVEFRANGFALIWQAHNRYQIVQIDQIVDDGTISLSDALEEFTDAWIVPLRIGYMADSPTRRFNGRNSVAELSFAIEDNASLIPPAPPQYLGADAYTDEGLLDGGETSERIFDNLEVFDESLGIVRYSSPWVHVKPQRIHRMMADGPQANWEMRQFLHRRAGRLVPFWQPSFESDLRLLSTGNLTTTISVREDDYMDKAMARTHIAIETAAGWLFRAVSAPLLTSPGVMRLTLSSSIATNAASIKRICFAGLRRLDTDRVEINWIGGRVSTCSVNTVEIAP